MDSIYVTVLNSVLVNLPAIIAWNIIRVNLSKVLFSIL